jgi:hypothetical protein
MIGVEGVPSASLHETVFAIEPFCLRVIARLSEPTGDDIRNLSGAGFAGVSARRQPHTGEAELFGWLNAYVRTVGRVAKTIFLHQVRDIREAHAVASTGVTHATLAPQRIKVHFIDDEPV